MRFIKFLQSREEGSVAAEYGLLIVGIAVVIGAAAVTLGGKIAGVYKGVF